MRVLAMAYKGRPLDREIVSIGDSVAYIADVSARNSGGTDAGDGIGFPKSCLFEFDSDLYGSLAAAWAAGDSIELERLWNAAKGMRFDA